MTHITLTSQVYGVEFRHHTRRLSHDQVRPKAPLPAGVKAITTCMATCVEGGSPHRKLSGIGYSFCTTTDNFDRRHGIRTAFERAAAECKEASWDRDALVAEMERLWPKRVVVQPPPRVRRVLGPAEVEAFYLAPHAVAKRNARTQRHSTT